MLSNVLTGINSSPSENFVVTGITLAERDVVTTMTTDFSFGVGLSQQPRFAVLDDAELEALQKKKNAKNTDSSTAFGANTLKKFCKETKFGDFSKLSELSIDALAVLLKRFYAGARKADGRRYKVNAIKGIRFALQRYFANLRDIDIISDCEFKEANLCFENVLKLTKSEGYGDTTHYPELEPEDLHKLYAGFNTNTPEGLQDKVWFDITFHLIRRGRENMRSMKKTSFGVGTDAFGRRFIFQRQGECDKNHGVHDHPFDTTGKGVIFETKLNNCPVINYEKYMTHLHPNCDSMWQKPRSIDVSDESIWYCNVSEGEKYLGGMMSRLSEKHSLSQKYTNH